MPTARLKKEWREMTLKEKILYHQIHPLKLGADVGCEPVRYENLEAYKTSRAGAFLRQHMTRTVEGVRFAGDIVMALGAWFHHASWIALGLAVVVLAWGNRVYPAVRRSCSGLSYSIRLVVTPRKLLCSFVLFAFGGVFECCPVPFVFQQQIQWK
jgi:hypothetical protein